MILIKDVFSNGIRNYTVYYVSKEYILIENSTGNYSEKYVYQDGVLVAQVDTGGNKKAVQSIFYIPMVVLGLSYQNTVPISEPMAFEEMK